MIEILILPVGFAVAIACSIAAEILANHRKLCYAYSQPTKL